jgi:hypothetical protein
LLRGGAFVGKNAKDYNRNLKNAIRMNSLSWKRGSSLRALFVYDDRKELVWLRNGKDDAKNHVRCPLLCSRGLLLRRRVAKGPGLANWKADLV